MFPTRLLASKVLVVGLGAVAVSFRPLVRCDAKPLVLPSSLPPPMALALAPKSKPPSSTSILLSMVSSFDWVLFGLAAVCSVLSSLMTTLQAKGIGKLFDGLGNPEADMRKLSKQLLGVFFMQSALAFASSTSLSAACTNLGVNLRVEYFSKLLRQDMAVLDAVKTGELTHQLSQDIAALQTTIRESFTRGVESVTSLVAGSYFLFSLSPQLALGLSVLLPVGAMAGTLLGEGLRALNHENRLASNRATGVANESLTNVRTVRAFANEDKEIARYGKQLHHAAAIKSQMAVLSGAFYSAVMLGVNLTTVLIGALGHHFITSGSLTKGDVAAIATQVQMLERALARLSVLSAQISKAGKASEHIFDTLKRQPVVTGTIRIPRHELRGNLDLWGVSFSYPNRPNALVLDKVQISAHQGQVVAVVGSSGSGKSTLFSLLERFYDADQGNILLDGVDIKLLDPSWLRENIGYVPQKPDLFSGSIADNVRYGAKKPVTHEDVVQACKRAHAHDFIQALPMGYDTVLGEQGIGMSGGQRQRLCIARTLLLDPKILLLDEITSGLDSESEFLVSQALDELMKGRTCLVIAHRLNTVKNASKIYVLEDGQVIESGTHDSLVKLQGAYFQFWQKQNRGLKRAASAGDSRQS